MSVVCLSVQIPDETTVQNVLQWWFCLFFTFRPTQLPHTDSPPHRWFPAHLFGWPAWLNSAPHTWSHTGTPHGCRERWCVWCRYPPVPPWCSLGQARSSSPDQRRTQMRMKPPTVESKVRVCVMWWYLVPYERIRSSTHCFWPAHTCHRSSASTPEQQCCTPPSGAPTQKNTSPLSIILLLSNEGSLRRRCMFVSKH